MNKPVKCFLVAMSLAISAPALADTAEPPAPAAPPATPMPEAQPPAAASQAGLDNSISAFGVFGYWYASTGVGLAGRYQKTINRQGVLHLPNIHDDIGFEGGVDYYHYGFAGYSLNEFLILAGVTWNFWLAEDKIAVYPKIEMGFGFGSFSNGVDAVGYGGFTYQGLAGIAYKLSSLTLRGEVGSGTLRLGAGVVF
jgi:hypothetical protein